MLVGIEVFQRIARSGQVGQPVFFRCALQCRPALAEEATSRAIAAAVAVIGDRPRALFARGSAAEGSLYALLDFFGGPSALVIVGPGAPKWDGMLLGNHGAAYLEGGGPTTSDQQPTTDGEGATTEDAAERLVVGRWSLVLRRALAESHPIAVAEADDA